MLLMEGIVLLVHLSLHIFQITSERPLRLLSSQYSLVTQSVISLQQTSLSTLKIDNFNVRAYFTNTLLVP